MLLEAISFGSCKAYLLCVDEREREREREREGGNKKRADMFRVAMGFIFRAYYSKL